MKIMSSIFLGSLLLFFTATCNNANQQKDSSSSAVISENSMEITGTIEQQGMTSYQYGTHTITTADDQFYALKSESIDLDTYLNEEVTIIAEKIEGYPLSGGPEFLLVLEVK